MQIKSHLPNKLQNYIKADTVHSLVYLEAEEEEEEEEEKEEADEQ